MTDTPTPYPPPQLVITYSGGRDHVVVAGEEGQKVFVKRAEVAFCVLEWGRKIQISEEMEAAQ